MQKFILTKTVKTIIKKIMKTIYKMEKADTKFGDIKIKKQKFHQYEIPILIDNTDLNRIVVSNKVS